MAFQTSSSKALNDGFSEGTGIDTSWSQVSVKGIVDNSKVHEMLALDRMSGFIIYLFS